MELYPGVDFVDGRIEIDSGAGFKIVSTGHRFTHASYARLAALSIMNTALRTCDGLLRERIKRANKYWDDVHAALGERDTETDTDSSSRES